MSAVSEGQNNILINISIPFIVAGIYLYYFNVIQDLRAK